MSLNDHLEKLPYFITIAKLGSFQAAAQALFLTQPTLSKSIKILEASIGKPLFHRHAKGVQLTAEGEILYREGVKVLQLMQSVSKELKHPQDPLSGTLRIGTYDSILIYFWAEFLKKFSKRHPRLKFEIKTMRSADVQKSLQNNELDFAFIISPKPASELVISSLQKDCFYFFESTARHKSYESLHDAPLIYMEQAFGQNREVFDEILQHVTLNDKSQRQIYLVSSLESVKELCLNGLGIGILPRFVASKEIKTKKLQMAKLTQTKWDRGFGEHDLSIAYKTRWGQSATLQDLIAQMKLHSWS